VNGGELVRRPDAKDDEEDEAGEKDCAFAAQAGVTADVNHADVGEPHGEGEEDFGVCEVAWAVGDVGEERADEQAGGHARESEEQGAEGDGVDGFKRGELDAGGCDGFGFEARFLHEIEERGDERDEEGGVGGEQQRDVQEEPAGVDAGELSGFDAGAEGGQKPHEEGEGEEKDAEREGAKTGVDEQEGEREEEAEERLGLVGIDGQAMVGGVEHLRERDEVEEDAAGGGGDGEMTPAGAVVERRRQHREGGDAVEEDRDSEPKERHRCKGLNGSRHTRQYIE
jgi:hypothetical protein